jgi:cytochrome c
MSCRRVHFLLILLAATLASCAACGGQGTHVVVGGGARASRAPGEIARYGCGSCHTISGVSGANAAVGPNLANFAQRRYIAGRLANTPANLIGWIRNPQQIDPGNVMPYLGVTPHDARDIAAYLYSH